MSNAIHALRQQRADTIAAAGALFETVAAEGREMTAEEIDSDNATQATLDRLDGQIAMAERQMERQRSMPTREEAHEAAANAAGTPRSNPRDERRFATLGEQLLAVARAGTPVGAGGMLDNRLQAATGLSEGISADGGFLVQTDFVAELLQNVWSGGEVANRVRKMTVGANSNGIRINGVDETSRANGSRWGGIQSYWTGEAQLKTASQPKFRQIRMELDKLTGLCYATDELLQDASALESWLMQAFSDEFVFKIEDSIINGTGAGQPLGILNSGAVITVSKESSQPNGTITAPNVYKMWNRLPPRSQQNAVWLVNNDVQAQFFQLYTAIKNVAGTENVGGIMAPQYLFQPPGTNGNTLGTLMGRPVIPVEYCATLGTAGDIILADLSQYLAIEKGPMQSASSIHVRFVYDETTFRFVYRYNGAPIWYSAVTPYKGTVTISPFIILQTR